MTAWIIYNYFDCVGNKDDGWYIGGESLAKSSILANDNATEDELLKLYSQAGQLKSPDMGYARRNGEVVDIYLARDDMPIGRLQKTYKKP